MFDIGFPEFFIATIVALVVLGPTRLPAALRTLGLWIGRLRRSYYNVKTEVEREIGMDEGAAATAQRTGDGRRAAGGARGQSARRRRCRRAGAGRAAARRPRSRRRAIDCRYGSRFDQLAVRCRFNVTNRVSVRRCLDGRDMRKRRAARPLTPVRDDRTRRGATGGRGVAPPRVIWEAVR